jgi:ABC-2 type transport system permease protein
MTTQDTTLPPDAPEPEDATDRARRPSRFEVRNPVLRRELLERWRGRRAVTALTIYLALLIGGIALLRVAGTFGLREMAMGGWGPPPTSTGPLLGRFLLDNILGGVLSLVLFVTPAYAAAAIAGERERRTLGLLRITLVRPRSIVLGKLGVSSAWITVLVIASAPIAASAFVLGGSSLGDLLRGLLVILVVATSVAAMALWVSSRARRTTGAVVATYALVLFLVVGTLFTAFAEFAAQRFEMPDDQRPVTLVLNPYYALADATGVSTDSFGMGLPSVLTPFAAMLPRQDVLGGPVAFDGQPMDLVDDGGFAAPRGGVGVWPISVVLYLALAGLALWRASTNIGPRDGVRET